MQKGHPYFNCILAGHFDDTAAAPWTRALVPYLGDNRSVLTVVGVS